MHMSHEGGGMKLRDLARSSRNPTSFMPAIHIFRSRLRNGGTARRARKSYESVPDSSPALYLLISLQQTTMVPVHRVFCRPGHPGSPLTFHTRTHHGDQNFRPRAGHRTVSFLHFLMFEQSQREIYREVLIAGDLSQEDVDRAAAQLGAWVVSLLQSISAYLF